MGWDLLFAGGTNYHRRNVFHIDERVEIFRASEIGKMNDVVRYLCDLAAHFLPRSQVQLDTFTGAALKKASDRRIRLQAGFILLACLAYFGSRDPMQEPVRAHASGLQR